MAKIVTLLVLNFSLSFFFAEKVHNVLMLQIWDVTTSKTIYNESVDFLFQQLKTYIEDVEKLKT